MRRGVALLAVGLLLGACSSAVPGQAGTDGAAIAAMSPVGAPTAGGRAAASGTLTPGAPAPAAPTTAAPVTTAPTTPPPSSAPTSADTGAAASASSAPELRLPAGFYAAGGDLGYRPMSGDEFDCTPDQLSGCFGIMVFSAPGCPAGATVTVGIFDKAQDPDHSIGTATGTTPPIGPDGSQAVVIGDTTGVAANLTARVQRVVC